MAKASSLKKFGIIAICLQVCFLFILGFLGDYDDDLNASYNGNVNATDVQIPYSNSVQQLYPMFQDVQGMMFLGFGFLMTFLKKYGYGSVGLNFMICAIVIQWSSIIHTVPHMKDGLLKLNIEEMLNSEFTLASVLISFGAVLGKISPLQLLIMAMIEVPIMIANEHLGRHTLMAIDIGDSIFVHTFGAYFGLAAAKILTTSSVEKAAEKKEGSTYHSDLFAMIGTLVLWIFWPSFNSAAAPGDDQHRAALNTFYALTGSTVMTFAISCLTSHEGKFDMVHVQNATLAGGVAIGASADLVLYPAGAIGIGCIAGTISTLGYIYLTPRLNKKKLHDTCGVHNLHGMPGIIGGICSAIVTAFVTKEQYGNSIYLIFEGMRPISNSTMYFPNRDKMVVVEPLTGGGRSASTQACYQLLALACTLIIAIIGGLLTGLILKIKFWNNLTTEDLFDDQRFWKLPKDYESVGVNLVEIYSSNTFHRENDDEMPLRSSHSS